MSDQSGEIEPPVDGRPTMPERLGKLPRPWCCPEPRCIPIHQLSDSDNLRVPSPGDSFSCWGVLGSEVAFSYDGVEHSNDLRSCHYTPLKGIVMWQENADDWALLRDAYAAALAAYFGRNNPPDGHA